MEKKEQSFAERMADFKARHAQTMKRSEASDRRIAQLEEEGRVERKQFDRDMYDIAHGKKPKDSVPVTSVFQQRLSAIRERLERSRELNESQRHLLDEMAANPLERDIDAVFADMGRKLQALDEEELAEDREEDLYLTADEQSEKADEELERSGKPPPLRLVK